MLESGISYAETNISFRIFLKLLFFSFENIDIHFIFHTTYYSLHCFGKTSSISVVLLEVVLKFCPFQISIYQFYTFQTEL